MSSDTCIHCGDPVASGDDAECEICGRRSRDQRCLECHMEVVHGKLMDVNLPSSVTGKHVGHGDEGGSWDNAVNALERA